MHRRHFLLFLLVCLAAPAGAAEFHSDWPATLNRVWLGPEFWSNPLQDWRIRNGRLECFVAGGDRNVFLLTREIQPGAGDLQMSVRLGRLEDDTRNLQDGFAGFRLGVRGAFHDYRDSAVRGVGLNVGLNSDGRLFIGRVEPDAARVPTPLQNLELRVTAKPAGQRFALELQALNSEGRVVGAVSRQVPDDWITGGVALVCSSGAFPELPPAARKTMESGITSKPGTVRGGTMRFWFRDWKLSGVKVAAHDDHTSGPILFAMHTLSRRVLRLTAQMAPVEPGGKVELQTRGGNNWRTIGSSPIDALSRTATFRVPKWDDTRDTPYRVRYGTATFEGTIRRDPRDKPAIVVAAFTGNNDLGFPHADVVRNVNHFRPDLLFFTGDQIYERVGEYGTQRQPLEAAALDYLRKWYEFGWEYRDLLKDIPAVALPDDHDVYHGNIWGAGGRRAEGEGYVGNDQGGYTMPAEFVNAVQRTQTSHMPDPFDPSPVDQGITVYYGPMLYGGLSVAIIEDRKWKSAPKEFLPKAQIVNGWAQNPQYNAAKEGDAPGAQLLGKRQLDFLNRWAQDWSGGAWMKVVVSQTLFANVATLPKGERGDNITPKLKVMAPGEYAEGEELVADHDSNGWPQTPRNDALRAMRRAVAFHISGDQHLGSTVQYGIDGWNDAGWAICVPSVANVWPRRWFPPHAGRNQKPGAPRYSGEYLDGFGNRVTVHAVSNPTEVDAEPRELHRRAPGYGIISFDRSTGKITMANWPRWIDVSKPGARPYDGWPITIDQADNGLPRNFLLPEVKSAIDDPIVQVISEANREVLYTLRIRGRSFTPGVFNAGVYTVRVFDPERKYERVYRGQRPATGK